MSRSRSSRRLCGTYRPQYEPLEDRRLPSGTADAFGNLPLFFEANQGQADAQVRYLARGPGYAVLLSDSGADLHLYQGGLGSGQDAVLHMQLVGANATPLVAGRDAQAGHANYLVGDDPAQWHTDVPLFSRVEYQQVYPGIDVVYYGNDQHQLEYDFDLAPGADPSQVALRFDGQQGLALDSQGNLVLHLAGGDVVEQAPVIYQDVAGARQRVEGNYVLHPDGTIGLQIGRYDASQTLVVDPTLVYSLSMGGSNYDQGFGVAVDPSGNVYLTGFTESVNFPTVNAVQGAYHGGQDCFVVKLNAAGALLYSTYLGGSGDDWGTGIATDAAGNAYVTGFTHSTNFPTKNPLQAANGFYDAFVAKLNPTGSALVYSTYLGGSADGSSRAIAVDGSGNAYITGYTIATNYLTAQAEQPTNHGGADAIVAKLGPTGGLVYSTYLGGSGDDYGEGIAVDASGQAYVTGETFSTNFPVAGAFQAASGGGSGDAFVTKLSATGLVLAYSTYLGGSGTDIGKAIAVDAAGAAYLTGYTNSVNFPTKSAFQPAIGGGTDAFVTKLSASGATLSYSTYLGGSAEEDGYGLAVDGAGNAYVDGFVASSNFPTANAYQPTYGGGTGFSAGDAFVSELNAAGTGLVGSTYLGGTDVDGANAIAVDGAGYVYVTGTNASANFPAILLPGAAGSNQDVFLAKLTLAAPASGPLVYTAPAAYGANNLVLRRNGATLELRDNGLLVTSQALAITTGVQITGAGGVPNTLTIDNSAGGLLQFANGIRFTGAGGSNTLVLIGTPGADALSLTPGTATLDSVEAVTFSNVQAVTAFGGAGDSAYLFDGPGSNTLTGTPSYATLSGPGYSNTVSGFPTVSAFASAGTDAALLFDGPTSDLFVGTPTYSYLQAGNSVTIASGFKSVRGSSSGGDLALLFDSTGNDIFVGYPTYSYLGGSGFLNLATGFAQVRGNSGGGQDAALLFDSAGDDLFRSTASYDFLGGTGYLNLVTGFGQVSATASAGGSDTADLYDSPGNDTFTGQPGLSSLVTPGYFVQAQGFGRVSVTSGSGSDEADLFGSPGNDLFTELANGLDALDYQTAGHLTVAQFAVVKVQAGAGNDTAYLTGHAGANTFTAGPTSAVLSGTGYAVTVSGFKTVQAVAGSSGDVAQLADSAGDDVFIGTPSSSSLQSAQQGTGASYLNQVIGFSQVYATATTGNDVAQLSEAGGANSFFGSHDFSYLTGAGYFNQVTNFFQVSVNASAGSQDTATLQDSSENDVFSGLGANALLFGSDYVVSISAFAQVAATSSTGGSDRLFLQPLNYLFTQLGNWFVPLLGTTVPTPPVARQVA
jgi:hypothetical protein